MQPFFWLHIHLTNCPIRLMLQAVFIPTPCSHQKCTSNPIHSVVVNQVMKLNALSEADLGLLQNPRWSTIESTIELRLGCCRSSRSASDYSTYDQQYKQNKMHARSRSAAEVGGIVSWSLTSFKNISRRTSMIELVAVLFNCCETLSAWKYQISRLFW